MLWLGSAVVSGAIYTRTWSLGAMALAVGLALLGAGLIARPSQDRGRFVRAGVAALLGVFTPVALLIVFLLAACPDSGCFS